MKVEFSWVPFFSQTGTEILDIIKATGITPEVIVTNERPDHLRTINPELEETFGDLIITVPNKPSLTDYKTILDIIENPFITLHGWLRIVPEEICNDYKHIINCHPGLITDYPELKGKDPQVRTWEGIQENKYPTAGTVLHKVSPGVDEGMIISSERFNTFTLESLDRLFEVLRDRSLYMWTDLFKKYQNLDLF